MYRTFISVSVCCLLSIILNTIWFYVPECFILKKDTLLTVAGCIGLIVLFIKAHKKQTGYVVSRAKTILADADYRSQHKNEKNDSLK